MFASWCTLLHGAQLPRHAAPLPGLPVLHRIACCMSCLSVQASNSHWAVMALIDFVKLKYTLIEASRPSDVNICAEPWRLFVHALLLRISHAPVLLGLLVLGDLKTGTDPQPPLTEAAAHAVPTPCPPQPG